ncbi:MAG: LysR family transcriptional regulator [Bacillota bacterium]|nr:LysR family transcriptional regulator [Bacillota bacterium]
MSLIKYRAIASVSKHGSITKAANELGYTQPGISRMINSLEDELGITLLKKSNSMIEPTTDCEELLPYIEEMLQQEDKILEKITSLKTLVSGGIRIGSMNSMIVSHVPDIIKAYAGTYPNIELTLLEMSMNEIVDGLQKCSIDIGFINEFHIKGLEFIPLFKDHIRLIVNKDHPFASYDKIPLSALNGCDLIMFTPDANDIAQVISEAVEFEPAAKYYVSSDSAGISMVSKNLGSYIISDIEMQTKLLNDSIIIKEFKEDIYRTMGIGVRSIKDASPALKELINMTKHILNT